MLLPIAFVGKVLAFIVVLVILALVGLVVLVGKIFGD